VARVVGDYPEAGPDYALAEAVGAEEGVVEEGRGLDLWCGEAVPEGDEENGAVCEVAGEVEERPE
jgi:hypothetical protein